MFHLHPLVSIARKRSRQGQVGCAIQRDPREVPSNSRVECRTGLIPSHEGARSVVRVSKDFSLSFWTFLLQITIARAAHLFYCRHQLFHLLRSSLDFDGLVR